MKYLALALFPVLLCAASGFAQTKVENKPNEPVSLAELAKQRVCGSQLIARLNDDLKEQPQNTDLYLQRASCFKQLKNPAFLKDVLTIIDLNPKLNDSLYVALNSLVFSKQPEESQANLKYLTAAIPNHWYLNAVRAEFKKAQKDYQGAIADWVKVIDSTPLTIDITPLMRYYRFWQPMVSLEESTSDKETFGFYDRFFNAAQNRQQKLSGKLKELPFNSKEYKEVRSNIEQIGGLLRSICYSWAARAGKLGNTQMESAALEKMVAFQPLWQSYQLRSSYYKTAKNDQKALADEIRSIHLQIEAFQDEIKQAESQAQRSALNSRISELYTRLGDIYFRNEQFVKAISQYEKAKPYSQNKYYLELRINAALRKLNVPEQKPEHRVRYEPALRP